MSRFGLGLGAVLGVLGIALVGLGLISGGRAIAADDLAASLRAFQQAGRAHAQHSPRLLGIKGVAGTAIGLGARGDWALKVYTVQPGVAGIPERLDGVPVEVEVTGALFALKPPAAPSRPGTSRRRQAPRVDPRGYFERPVPIGVSTGNANEVSAGTIACRVKDTAGNVYALSNNHVFARENEAEPGEEILQPGLYDIIYTLGDTDVNDHDYRIGILSTFVPIFFDGTLNRVDAALALSHPAVLGNATPSNGYGSPQSEIASAFVGQAVQKYGRTTALTKGHVSGISATVNVIYWSGTATFTDQIVVRAKKGKFIGAGDSGSLLVSDRGRQPVGLLFAGTSDGRMAIANRIDLVLETFQVTVDGQ